jgi:hypothetical protein
VNAIPRLISSGALALFFAAVCAFQCHMQNYGFMVFYGCLFILETAVFAVCFYLALRPELIPANMRILIQRTKGGAPNAE